MQGTLKVAAGKAATHIKIVVEMLQRLTSPGTKSPSASQVRGHSFMPEQAATEHNERNDKPVKQSVTSPGTKLPSASQARGHSSMRSTAPGTCGPGTGLAMWLRLREPSPRSPRRLRFPPLLSERSIASGETVSAVLLKKHGRHQPVKHLIDRMILRIVSTSRPQQCPQCQRKVGQRGTLHRRLS